MKIKGHEIIKPMDYILCWTESDTEEKIKRFDNLYLDNKKVIYLDCFKIVSKRGKGLGSKILQQFLKEHRNEGIVLVDAGVISGNLYSNLDKEKYPTKLEAITHFYRKNNFYIINDYLENDSRNITNTNTLMYLNASGIRILKKLEELNNFK